MLEVYSQCAREGQSELRNVPAFPRIGFRIAPDLIALSVLRKLQPLAYYGSLAEGAEGRKLVLRLSASLKANDDGEVNNEPSGRDFFSG